MAAASASKPYIVAFFNPCFNPTSNESFENSVTDKNNKSKKGRRSKFKSLIIEKDFEPENPKTLEELDENSCKWPIGHPDEKISISVEDHH